MSGPRRDGIAPRAWRWLWRDASIGERVVVLVAALAIVAAVVFVVVDAVGGGSGCHCGP